MALHLSESAESVKARAADLSRRWKHHYISCEHIFLACCIEDSGCEGWLNDQGFSIEEFEEAIIDLVPMGDDKPIWDGLPESPRIRRIMSRNAQEEAESQRAVRVEPIHILRAIIKEGKSIPCRIVREEGGEKSRPGSESAGRESPSDSLRGPVGGSSSSSSSDDSKKKSKKTPNLDKYSRDIVALVGEGKVEPIVGRNDEVRRVMQILARKTKSNPVLIGEAGVGKTAVAFALARRIYEGKVPDALKNKKILELSLSSMVAGAKHRGEFEERLEGVTKETMADPSIILFIDEIHQLVGAGDSRGGMDASNILKPALARGDLRVLGATTTDEFAKYIEKDPALERRFQPVLVGEPSEEDALEMLKGIRKRFESHHGVNFTDDALATAVSLSVRYLPDRNLPDKAIDLIDEAAARVKTRSGVFQLDAQGRASMSVGEDVVAEVVADWTGIPVQRMSEQESTRLLRMETELAGKVVGQDHAVEAVAQAIRVVRVGLVAPNRPGGVFLFMGPSGVGKTELAKALADFLFGDPGEIVRLDMSEYHDKSSINRMIGSPPGYVGHDEEGQLTKAVRKKPYSVVLLDEVEKAHPEIFDLFLQVFDDGRLTDSKGRTVNFTNTIIIMTSNLGSRELLEANLPNHGYAGQLESLPAQYQKALRGHFRPEFLNRVDEIIAFRALEKSDLVGIAEIHLGQLKKQLKKSRGVELELRPSAMELILHHGYQPQFGARPLKRAISTYLQRPLAEEMLRNPPQEGDVLVARREGREIVFSPEIPGQEENERFSTLGGDQNYRPGTEPAPAAPPAPVEQEEPPQGFARRAPSPATASLPVYPNPPKEEPPAPPPRGNTPLSQRDTESFWDEGPGIDEPLGDWEKAPQEPESMTPPEDFPGWEAVDDPDAESTMSSEHNRGAQSGDGWEKSPNMISDPFEPPPGGWDSQESPPSAEPRIEKPAPSDSIGLNDGPAWGDSLAPGLGGPPEGSSREPVESFPSPPVPTIQQRQAFEPADDDSFDADILEGATLPGFSTPSQEQEQPPTPDQFASLFMEEEIPEQPDLGLTGGQLGTMVNMPQDGKPIPPRSSESAERRRTGSLPPGTPIEPPPRFQRPQLGFSRSDSSESGGDGPRLIPLRTPKKRDDES